MSRSHYTDDCENLEMWRGAVASAIREKRGQALLREMAEAMDAMPVRELIAGALQEDGAYCALGVVGAKRGMDMNGIDPEEPDEVGQAFNIANALAQEIEYINDEAADNLRRGPDGKYTYIPETPEERWLRVRKWVGEQIK